MAIYRTMMLKLSEMMPDASRDANRAIEKYEPAEIAAQHIRHSPRESEIVSEKRPMNKTKAKDKRYGGADSICDVSAEKDIAFIIVGKKTGREAKETLIEKNIRA